MSDIEFEAKVRNLADEHWEWIEQVLSHGLIVTKFMFIEGFIHGFKHGKEVKGEGLSQKV